MRFPEFSGEWENKTLKSVLKCHDNFRIPLSDKQRKNMKGQYAYYGANGIIDFIDKFIFNGNYILLAEDGGKFDEFRTKPIAHKASGKFWVNNHAHVLSTNNILDFVFYQLEHKDIRSFINIGSRSKLNKNDMFNIIISLCSLKEQSKIANFLSLIDKRIELQNKIIKNYELLKKVLNYRLFNYDNDNSFLRFPEFSGEWTKRKIKNILKCYSTSYSMVDILLEGETPIYDANTLVGYINECGYKEKYIAIIKDGASVGTIRLLPKNTTHISTINGLLSQTENIDFLYFALQGLNFTKYIVGSGIPHIYFRDYSSMNISIPSSKEQLKIANFLSKLDEILLNVKCEKERLIKNKTFLLQNLFI